ncbi:uncharacterized protein CPUR_02848 [Claviceps purpurea 20.1]|uniref:Uncharacterized protein n=1 Tax=Claviceps purpurea (strain 20.1) TaxID=1111077 RepID=M1VVA0_CLAP2|nr:uncharacterized protein CPUR_02848 [Claviceps purpurea 20.1]
MAWQHILRFKVVRASAKVKPLLSSDEAIETPRRRFEESSAVVDVENVALNGLMLKRLLSELLQSYCFTPEWNASLVATSVNALTFYAAASWDKA